MSPVDDFYSSFQFKNSMKMNNAEEKNSDLLFPPHPPNKQNYNLACFSLMKVDCYMNKEQKITYFIKIN